MPQEELLDQKALAKAEIETWSPAKQRIFFGAPESLPPPLDGGPMLIDQPSPLILKGHIKIYRMDDPSVVVFEANNIICNSVKALFARMMANKGEPEFGVWGLAIGAGSSEWTDPLVQPDATKFQTALFNEIRRKQCSQIRFLDNTTDRNPILGCSETVEFQTILNATTDDIKQPIREMGLIGGGSTSHTTNMATASYWDPAVKSSDSVTLINYKTLPSLELPLGINFIASWCLSFVLLLMLVVPNFI